MSSRIDPREEALELAANTHRDNATQDLIAGATFALVYVGDQLANVEDADRTRAIERLATEAGGIGTAIGGLGHEIRQHS